MISSVGPFSVGSLISETSHALFFDSHHPISGQKLLVKVLKNKESDLSKNECSALTNLRHPNIIRPLGIYETPESVGIVFPYYELGDLFNYIVDHPLSEYAARRVIKQVLNAISYMHSASYWHRDIKAENILITDIDKYGPNIVVADLGFSIKVKKGSMLNVTLGTKMYMGPELQMFQSYSNKVDIWSIGVLTYILLSNSFPFPDQPTQLIYTVMGGYYSLETGKWSLISSCAKDFVRKTLCVNPSERVSALEALELEWFDEYLLKPNIKIIDSHVEEDLFEFEDTYQFGSDVMSLL